MKKLTEKKLKECEILAANMLHPDQDSVVTDLCNRMLLLTNHIRQKKSVSVQYLAFAEWCQVNCWSKYKDLDRWVCKDGNDRKGLRPMTGEELFAHWQAVISN